MSTGFPKLDQPVDQPFGLLNVHVVVTRAVDQ